MLESQKTELQAQVDALQREQALTAATLAAAEARAAELEVCKQLPLCPAALCMQW